LKNEVARDQKQVRLIFEPNSKARYQTTEFDFVADINGLGLRDREIRIEKGDKYRILCFGDSFTFGWGVNVENSWPKKLEQYLLTNGYENIEIINCGQGGKYTRIYKKYIEKAVPLLKPDLVLVGVVQLDDLAQLYEHNFIINQTYVNAKILKNVAREIKSVLRKYLKYSFRNIFSLLGNREANTVEIKTNWKASANSIIKNFKHLQKIRFYTLDDSVRSLFKSGNLNAGLLNYYINYPDRTIIFNNPNHSATKFSIREMNKDLKGMRDISDKYNSKLIFINLPTNYFTGHIVIRTPTDFLNSYFETNNNIDPVYRSIANANNLPYIELTKHFIGLQNKSEYFFRYDGHPNEKGYEEIAKYIGKQLIKQDILKKE
jgi:lysophospholipase L1-like esterase